MKTFFTFMEDIAKLAAYERTRHDDDYAEPILQRLQNPRLRRLRRLFNREIKRYTV